ncbi:MAG: sulfotransferase [Actinomycetota bacterium]|nr:sulfotransferase [Actinomycetota bacterium]
MTLPNFIVIGAAKAGTTALHWYLADHPQVFMTSVKETNYFAFGLDDEDRLLYGDPELHHFPIRSLEEYERSFDGAGEAVAIGEASPIYLEAPRSAARIAEVIPGARIVCGIREPVDRAYSDHLMYLRSRGRRLDPARDLTPSAAWAAPDSHWMQISRYYEPLRRYFDVFPRQQIHVFLFDDLKKDQAGVVRDLYRFLGVDPDFRPDFDTPHNIGGMPSSMLVEKVLTSGRLKRALDPWVPKRAADLARRIRTRNMRRAPALPPELKAVLQESFRDDIDKTSGLIGRDLSSWLRSG